MISVPAPIDQDGNITFSDGEGLVIPVSSIGATGLVINIASAPIWFNVGGGAILRVSLGSDPSNPSGRKLIVTPAQLQSIGTGGAPYTFTDESGLVPVVLAEGLISRRNPALVR